jgi:hypothetical protein
MIDYKFEIIAVNPINGNVYTEEDAFVFCAKDAAVPAALEAYIAKCEELGANKEHIQSVRMLADRVNVFQSEYESRVPDTVGGEIERCLHGVGIS